MNNSMNYYELLGVEKNASSEEIKEAYKKQMKKWHPDINKSENAINMSAKINEAKEILLDEIKRKDYDEYLDKKIKEDYNRYTQQKTQKENTNQDNNQYKENNQYKDNNVTKWQYLSDWLNYANVSFIRKIIGLFGVLLESLFCFIFKNLIILLAFIIFFLSDFIRTLYNYLALPIGLFLLYVIYLAASYGYNDLITNHYNEFISSVILVVVYISTYILPILGTKLISPEVFNFLYNKIDINLFKLSVGYKK